MTEKMKQFQSACRLYLNSLGIMDLRNYGRDIGVARPTAKKKEDLIEAIIGVFTGELLPIPVSKHGAPVKNDRVDERIPAKMQSLKAEFFANDVMIEIPDYDFAAEYKKMQENNDLMLRVADPEEEKRGFVSKYPSCGQVDYAEGGYRLLPFNCAEEETRIHLPEELVVEKDLREGDLLTCYTRKNPSTGVVSVATVASVNGFSLDKRPPRVCFDEQLACAPQERIRVYDKEKSNSVGAKFIEWLMPLVKGHRGCIISSPKAGKSRLLLEIAKSASTLNEKLQVYVLLVEQSPEGVGEFRRVLGDEQLFYTTYEDAPERQVLMADFLLKRIKRRVESGADVLLLVDSLTALAHAFNDTEASSGGKTLACGLEMKTVRYIKKYFGAARCLEEGGSLTIFGTVSEDTGNPFDEVLAAEYATQANFELHLNNALAVKRVYPAVDFTSSKVKGSECYKKEAEENFEVFLRNDWLHRFGMENLLKVLSESTEYEEFVVKIKKSYEK